MDDLQKEGLIFQIGVAPCRIDILTSIDGLKFEDAFARSPMIDIEGIPIHVLSIPDLIINKRATGRTKDLADAETLEEADAIWQNAQLSSFVQNDNTLHDCTAKGTQYPETDTSPKQQPLGC